MGVVGLVAAGTRLFFLVEHYKLVGRLAVNLQLLGSFGVGGGGIESFLLVLPQRIAGLVPQLFYSRANDVLSALVVGGVVHPAPLYR